MTETKTSPYVQLLLRDFDTVKREHWDEPLILEHTLGNISAFLDGLGELYGARDELKRRVAELRGVPKLPARRYRSSTQERVSRCPRCGDAA